eukprot:COSAG01_NODE_35167_length_535_cov_95.155963_1_plen_21_part_10
MLTHDQKPVRGVGTRAVPLHQ